MRPGASMTRGAPPKALSGALSGLMLGVLLAGCASPAPPAPEAAVDSIILLPEKDGRATSVTMSQGERRSTLDQPYAGARTSAAGPQAFASSALDVQAKFGAALAAQPPRPTSFLLYFVEGRDVLTDDSKAVVEQIFTEIGGRPAPDIAVIGHTDTVGGPTANDALSLLRAESIRRELLRRGIAPENVQASGRGERELLVPTADNVAEPRNRRVEIIVR